MTVTSLREPSCGILRSRQLYRHMEYLIYVTNNAFASLYTKRTTVAFSSRAEQPAASLIAIT